MNLGLGLVKFDKFLSDMIKFVFTPYICIADILEILVFMSDLVQQKIMIKNSPSYDDDY